MIWVGGYSPKLEETFVHIYIYIYSEPERGSYSLILGIQSKQWKTTTSRKHAPQIPRHIEEKEWENQTQWHMWKILKYISTHLCNSKCLQQSQCHPSSNKNSTLTRLQSWSSNLVAKGCSTFTRIILEDLRNVRMSDQNQFLLIIIRISIFTNHDLKEKINWSYHLYSRTDITRSNDLSKRTVLYIVQAVE